MIDLFHSKYYLSNRNAYLEEWIRQAVIVFNHIIDEQELRFDEPTQTTIIKLLKIARKIEKGG